MKFSELATYLNQLEATKSRNELVRILSELYRACSVDEIEPITYLIQGRLAPFFAPVEIGLGEKLLVSAMAIAEMSSLSPRPISTGAKKGASRPWIR